MNVTILIAALSTSAALHGIEFSTPLACENAAMAVRAEAQRLNMPRVVAICVPRSK